MPLAARVMVLPGMPAGVAVIVTTAPAAEAVTKFFTRALLEALMAAAMAVAVAVSPPEAVTVTVTPLMTPPTVPEALERVRVPDAWVVAIRPVRVQGSSPAEIFRKRWPSFAAEPFRSPETIGLGRSPVLVNVTEYEVAKI